MRQIGTLNSEADARRFAAYLVTRGITAHAEQDGDSWVIWVRDENQLEAARSLLADFRSDPQDARYRDLETEADSILREEAKRREQARKNIVQVRGQWGRLALRRRPLVLTLIGLSLAVGVMSNMGIDQRGSTMRALLFIDPTRLSPEGWEKASAGDRFVEVRRGEIWRVITPIFVHFGAIHLAFNMIMLFQLGGAIENRRGTWRTALLVSTIAVCSNLCQALVPTSWGGWPLFAGMSGVVYGLFGYIWMKSLFAPRMGLLIDSTTVTVLMVWLFLGFGGAFEKFGLSMANWAHGIGLLVGVVIGFLPTVVAHREHAP